jgi:prepilin-type N-terminal cleavage/methylation domain-containing protein
MMVKTIFTYNDRKGIIMIKKIVSKGFTLVELIVVIAIVAILSAVSIVGFTRFIDNARMSNDNQVAQQMSSVLSAHFAANPLEEELNLADEIRSIIDQNHGKPFDFTPTSKDAGFFYIQATSRIQVYKYEDIIDGIVLLKSLDGTFLLNDGVDLNGAGFGSTPEEIFGANTYLLTTRGSVVAEVVSGLRQLANASDIDAAYLLLESKIDSLSQTLFSNPTVFKARLESFIETYALDQTLFISHLRWRSSVLEGGTITRIVFAPNMVHIPPYNGPSHLEYEDLNESLRPIKLPSSIKSAQVRFGAHKLEFPGGVPTRTPLTLFIDPEDYPNIRFISSVPLLPANYITIDNNNKLTLSMPSAIKQTVVGYDIRLFDTSSHHSVIIYTVNGILGEVRVPVTQT